MTSHKLFSKSSFITVRKRSLGQGNDLVDGDRHGDGYVTIIVINANKILVLPIRRVFVKVNTPVPRFCRE